MDEVEDKDDWLEELPLQPPCCLGLLADVADDQLVHEHNLVLELDFVPENDLGLLDVLEVLDV
eukprot:12909386-Prorocentrum_lima.AAC.1